MQTIPCHTNFLIAIVLLDVEILSIKSSAPHDFLKTSTSDLLTKNLSTLYVQEVSWVGASGALEKAGSSHL